jgi:hypothetical protein
MKLLKYISMIAAVLFITYSCAVDENGSMPNNIKEGCFPYIAFNAASSSAYININDPDAYSFSGTIDTLWDSPFDKLTLVVVFNGAYDKQYILKDHITELPLNIKVTTADLVKAVTLLKSSADIQAGDNFHVFVIPTIDGIAYPPYQSIGGNAYNTVSTGVYSDLFNIKGLASADVSIPVPCAFNKADYLGVMYCLEDWGGGETYEYTVTSIEDPDYSGSGVGLIITGFVDGADISITKATINLDDFSFNVAEQSVMPDMTAIGLPASYGPLSFSEVAGTVNTCDMEIVFTPDLFCDAGPFGPVTFTIQRFDYHSAKSIDFVKTHKLLKLK